MSTTMEEKEIEIPTGLPAHLPKIKIKEIAGYVLDGLSEDEACILAGYAPKVLKELKQVNEKVSIYFQKQAIEFKRKHLKHITAKPNEKNSMWLLEALRPEEFGPKKRGGDTTINVIGSIIKDVQQNNSLPVKEQSALPDGVREVRDIEVKDILK